MNAVKKTDKIWRARTRASPMKRRTRASCSWVARTRSTGRPPVSASAHSARTSNWTTERWHATSYWTLKGRRNPSPSPPWGREQKPSLGKVWMGFGIRWTDGSWQENPVHLEYMSRTDVRWRLREDNRTFARKIANKFAFSLAYSYLCRRYRIQLRNRSWM